MKKTFLIVLGILSSLVILEIALRIGGLVFLSLQDYRNYLSIRQKGTYRIICLGESTTAFGGKNSYPSQLEDVLNKQKIGIKFSVINKGIPGANTGIILPQLENNLDNYKPDMVIAMMGINDPIQNPRSYKYGFAPGVISFLTNLKISNFFRLLWSDIQVRAREGKGPDSSDKIRSNSPGALPSSGERYDKTQEESALKKAIESNPKNETAYLELGRLYISQANMPEAELRKKVFNKAKDIYKKLIEINPNNSDAYHELGTIYQVESDNSKAEELFLKSIELNPFSPAKYIDMGSSYQMQGKYRLAEDAYRKAITIGQHNNDHECSYWRLGEFYIEQKKYLQAELAFKKFVEMHPFESNSCLMVAKTYEKIGDKNIADEYYKKAVELGLNYYNPATRHNYQALKKILDRRGVKLVCVQYPVRSIEPLKRLLDGEEGALFVDNEKTFREALMRNRYSEYFIDVCYGDFGHCTQKGNRLLAQNIADVILKEVFREKALPLPSVQAPADNNP